MIPLLPLPYPVCGVSHCNERSVTLHSSSVFLQRKNIGEVARSDGGVKKTGENKKN